MSITVLQKQEVDPAFLLTFGTVCDNIFISKAGNKAQKVAAWQLQTKRKPLFCPVLRAQKFGRIGGLFFAFPRRFGHEPTTEQIVPSLVQARNASGMRLQGEWYRLAMRVQSRKNKREAPKNRPQNTGELESAAVRVEPSCRFAAPGFKLIRWVRTGLPPFPAVLAIAFGWRTGCGRTEQTSGAATGSMLDGYLS